MEKSRIINLLKELFAEFEEVGKNPGKRGVTRLGYEKEEDEMHEKLSEISNTYGLTVETDSAGNTIVSNVSPGEKYFLTGSHLDSVIEGGIYDGVLGVLVGLAILIISKEENLNIPLKVVAFRCEESSNFSMSTIGSKFFSGLDTLENLGNRVSKNDRSLKEIFEKRGLNPTPYDLSDAINFIEVHIEQGRVLELENQKIGVVSDIAGNRRFRLELKGMSEHSGATPMGIRKDAFCAAAEIALAVEKIGLMHEVNLSRATVGVVEVHPNALNVVPGGAKIEVDIRGIDNSDMDSIFFEISNEIERICNTRGINYEISGKSEMSAVKLDKGIVDDFFKRCEKLGIPSTVMPSGAGHDSMNIARVLPTGMLFIPCEGGISHNPLENIEFEDAKEAVRLLIDYYLEVKNVN